jgi:chain length determinant protein EpsF
MKFQQLLLVLRARYKMALFVLVATVTVTLAVSLLLPKRYTATATVVLDVKSPDPIAGLMLPGLMMPGYMATQVDIIESRRVAHKVVKMLKLDENPAVRQQWLEATEGKGKLDDWLAQTLRKRLQVKPARESSVVSIDYTASDPAFAEAIANAFAQAFIDTNVELKVEPAKQYNLWFGEQGKMLRDSQEKAQARLSEHQQKYGIIGSDERLDSETAKLNDLSAQLTVVQGQSVDARSKQRSGSAADTLSEVVQNPLILNLKGDIARQEARLQDTAVNLGKNHPQYQRMAAEIAALKRQLEAETRHITSGFSTSRAVSKEKEAELMAAVVAQKNKLLELKSQRDQLAILTRDVEAVQKAYDAVTQRSNQTSLESQSKQTNVAVLTPASAPSVPSSPKILLNTLIAVFLGTLLGLGAAFLLEIRDRRIRSAEDLVETLQVSMLGMIGRAKRRRRIALGYRKPALVMH